MQPIEYALKYAARGWAVLPLHTPSGASCSCGSQCRSPGKHPRIKGGVHSASTDINTIKEWWQHWPRANIGIATGLISNLLVIDLDERHDGIKSWQNWEHSKKISSGLIAKSGGGYHLYFLPGKERYKSRVAVMPGVDIRCEGGYIVAPGSLHASGATYQWISPDFQNIGEIPETLKQLLSAQTHSTPEKKSDSIPEGKRNELLTKIAGLLRRESIDSKLIETVLHAVNKTSCAPSLESQEITTIAQGMQRYSPKWGKIRNPEQEICSPPDLELLLLPNVMREWVCDASDRMQVPPEFFAAPCLVSFASVIGRQASIYPKQHDSWYEVANLWGAIIARPGLFKSPSITEATSFVRMLADKSSAQYEIESLRAEVKSETTKSRIDGLKEAIKKAARDGKSEDKIEMLQMQMLAMRENLEEHGCIHRRFLIGDSTVEKLSIILKENPNGVFLLRDELAGWATMINKREGDREFYLESWNGKNFFNVDRIGRGSLHIPNICLSVFGGIQPSKLSALCNIKGAGSDGLLQRFQILVYPKIIKNWKNIDRRPQEKAYQTLFQIFTKASELKSSHPHLAEGIRFSKEAQEMFNEWRASLEYRLRSGKIESEEFESHLSKYRALVPKLALLFGIMQSLNNADSLEEIRNESLQMALGWAKYLEQHATKVYQEELSIPQKGAVLLAGKIKSGAVKDGDSLRSIYRRHWSWLDTPEKLDIAVARLEECSWVIIENVTNNTGKSNILRINPDVYSIA